MRWCFDRTGFPELEIPDLGSAVQLLPVSKLQFECFLAEPVLEPAAPPEPALFGDSWYESVLAALPRASLTDASPSAYEALFLGGISPTEAARFARWLGVGYDFPRVDTWRAIDERLNGELFDDERFDRLVAADGLSRSARKLLQWWRAARRPRTWADLALLNDGLLEWVRVGPRQFGGLGRPRQEFQRILINPQRDEPVRLIHHRRARYFGVRLVRPLQTGATASP